MSKKSIGLYAFLFVLVIFSFGIMACGGTDGDGGGFLDAVVEVAEDTVDAVVEGEKQNWSEVGESVTGPKPSNKDSGFVGSAGKFICESRGYTWVASISACYEK